MLRQASRRLRLAESRRSDRDVPVPATRTVRRPPSPNPSTVAQLTRADGGQSLKLKAVTWLRGQRCAPSQDLGFEAQGINSRVERGAGRTAVRLPSPLVEPDVRISRIRLSNWLGGRLTTLRPLCGTCAGAAHQACRPCGHAGCRASAACDAGRGSCARGHTDAPRSRGPWRSGSRD